MMVVNWISCRRTRWLSIKAGLNRIPSSLDARLDTNFALDSKLETLEGRKAEAEARVRWLMQEKGQPSKKTRPRRN